MDTLRPPEKVPPPGQEGVSVELTPSDQRRWRQLYGEALETIAAKGMATKAYQDPAKRKAILEDVNEAAREAAHGRFLQGLDVTEIKRRLSGKPAA